MNKIDWKNEKGEKVNFIKIIDLLNKIANGEEVPKKIKYKQEIFDFRYFDGNLNYYNENYRCFGEDYAIDRILNDEVEIIEEDKTIEELMYKGEPFKLGTAEQVINAADCYSSAITGILDSMGIKINELVKEIKK